MAHQSQSPARDGARQGISAELNCLTESPSKTQSNLTRPIAEIRVGGLHYTATFSRYPDGRISELFLNNHKSNSAADTNARDAAIVFSIAVQCGADVETIRKALCRDGRGNASGPFGAALDRIAEQDERGGHA